MTEVVTKCKKDLEKLNKLKKFIYLKKKNINKEYNDKVVELDKLINFNKSKMNKQGFKLLLSSIGIVSGLVMLLLPFTIGISYIYLLIGFTFVSVGGIVVKENFYDFFDSNWNMTNALNMKESLTHKNNYNNKEIDTEIKKIQIEIDNNNIVVDCFKNEVTEEFSRLNMEPKIKRFYIK